MSGIGVNLRVTGHCNQGGRKYMEDMFSVAYQHTDDCNDLEYAFFGIFDGHGGAEAAMYAKEHLLQSIVQQKCFWSENDMDVLKAIHDGYIATHQAMWKEQENWARTQLGLPSTSGTTATVAFIKKGKIYIGHVGDSMLVLGYHDDQDMSWKCEELTKEHKPENQEEMTRIAKAGGKVVRKNGVPRVVWNRPKIGHKGPVRRSTPFDEIPFLAVARSLGDFWSYNSELDTFVVSPEPDVGVVEMDASRHRCLIFGTDGLWNMLTPQNAVDIVHFTELLNGETESNNSNEWINPSKSLVDKAIDKWNQSRSRADNTSVVTLLIDPPGPPGPKTRVKQEPKYSSGNNKLSNNESSSGNQHASPNSRNNVKGEPPKLPETGGMAIFTRYPGKESSEQEVLESLSSTSASSSSPSSYNKMLNKDIISKILNKPLEQHSKVKCPTRNLPTKPYTSPPRPNAQQFNDMTSDIMTTSCTSAAKRKRFRMDEKRSSLPLNMGVEECSGNSDTENERVASPLPPSPSSVNSKLSMKKPKVDVEKRQLQSSNHASSPSSSSASSSSTSSPCTRTLRSDTLASIPIKTLRSRNVNMSSPSTSSVANSSSALHPLHQSNGQHSHPRSKSVTSHSVSSTASSTSPSSNHNKKLKWK